MKAQLGLMEIKSRFYFGLASRQIYGIVKL